MVRGLFLYFRSWKRAVDESLLGINE